MSEKKYKVVFDKRACIGAAACAAVAPEFWEMQEDGKAHLVGTEEHNGREILYLTKELMSKKLRNAIEAAENKSSDEELEEQLEVAKQKNVEAAEVCPVPQHVFHIAPFGPSFNMPQCAPVPDNISANNFANFTIGHFQLGGHIIFLYPSNGATDHTEAKRFGHF